MKPPRVSATLSAQPRGAQHLGRYSKECERWLVFITDLRHLRCAEAG